MIKVFTETLKSFSHEKVMVNAPNDFPDKVNVGVRLEEYVHIKMVAQLMV